MWCICGACGASACRCVSVRICLDNGNTFLNSLVTVSALPLGGVCLTILGHHGPVCACTAQSLGMMWGHDAAMVVAGAALFIILPTLSCAPCLRAHKHRATVGSTLHFPAFFPSHFPFSFPPQPNLPSLGGKPKPNPNHNTSPSPHLTCWHPSHPCHTWPLLPVAATGRVGPGIAQRRRACHHALHPPNKI